MNKSQAESTLTLSAEQPRDDFRTRIRRFFERYPPLAMIAALWLLFMILVAIFAPLISPYDFTAIDLRARLQAPVFLAGGDWSHPFGTDSLGRDVLSRLIFSIRMSLFVAFLGTVIGAVLGTSLGFLAAHFRGWVDDIVMVGIDFQASLPFFIIALAFLAFFGNNLVLFISLMGIYGWERYARLTRGLTLSAMTRGYVVAVNTLGATPVRVYLRHVLPNISSALVVNMTLNFPGTVILMSSLSFLGIGIQPPLTSLGNMLGFGRDYLTTAWWITVSPGVTIFLATLSMSILGDWVRDRLDPTLNL
ncbi:MAG: ABC transporter permease [Spirochaetes bacterium]|nr:ABC transporter permease [Spirochaetota bacterium]